MSKKQQVRKIRFSEDILWGIHPVYESVLTDPGRVNEIMLHKDNKGGKREEIINLAKKNGIKVSFVNSIHLTGEGASEVRHQGVIAKINKVSLLPLDQFVEDFAVKVKKGEKPRVIVLDSLQDPHNVGAIIRSAHASGFDGVLVTRERSAPLGGTAAKSSAGAMAHIDICQVTNLVNALKKLKDVGAWVYGAIKDEEAQSIYQSDFDSPVCIVVGSEGKGVRPLVRKECDVLISIPMEGKLDSLNSSVAAGVIMFEILRQRN